jgi:enoyl-CoA hydratase/carnithine racemase
MRLLGEEVGRAISDAQIRVIVIAGKGAAFSAGGDIDEMATWSSALFVDTVMEAWHATFDRIARSPKPVIAAVNGFAYGGGMELAMACHIRVASADAVFAQSEIALDHLPGAGGTQRLPRLVPLGLAYEHLLTGAAITADVACRIGLVNHVWSNSEFFQSAVALGQKIAERAPTAVRLTMEAIREGMNSSLDAGLRTERALAGLALESEEARAGLRNFLEKRRKPNQ